MSTTPKNKAPSSLRASKTQKSERGFLRYIIIAVITLFAVRQLFATLRMTSTSSSVSSVAALIPMTFDTVEPNSGASRAPWTVFYNVYMSPNNAVLSRHSEYIVAEQLAQVGRSYVVQNTNVSGIPLFYNTVGKELNHSWLKDVAKQNGLDAVHLRHYDRAFEEVTIARVFEHCKSNPDKIVLYMHNKGSFHKDPEQDRLRRLYTHAATHQACMEGLMRPANVSDACQTCGFLMLPLPGIHYLGNIWTAQCDYVRRLAQPLSFGSMMDKLYATLTKKMIPSGLLRAELFNKRNTAYIGRNRFAFEHWIGSHPSLVKPCHVSPVPRIDTKFDVRTWTPRVPTRIVGRGDPGFPLKHNRWHFHSYNRHHYHVLLGDTRKRMVDYFLLPGLLFKSVYLYGESPPTESWVFKWFPDGAYWKSQLTNHPIIAKAKELSIYQGETITHHRNTTAQIHNSTAPDTTLVDRTNASSIVQKLISRPLTLTAIGETEDQLR